MHREECSGSRTSNGHTSRNSSASMADALDTSTRVPATRWFSFTAIRHGGLLRQIPQGLTRDPKVHRFKSFRETVVHECQHMPGLVALSAFGQQLSQGSR
jgi:hypothetical protein